MQTYRWIHLKHKLLVIVTFATIIVGVVAGQILRPETSNQVETENYVIKIVSDYPSQGSIESLVTVEDKRQIVLRNDLNANLQRRCKILYDNSITRHLSPCGALN